MNFEELIQLIIQDPSEENKNLYNDYIEKFEYDLILQNKQSEAYTIRGKCAGQILREWIKVYGSSEGCPASYQDTLNIPFRLEKNKHLKE